MREIFFLLLALLFTAATARAVSLKDVSVVSAQEDSVLEGLRRWILYSASWIFLLLCLLLLVLLVRSSVAWLQARRRAKPASRTFQIRIRVRSPAGALSLHTFDFSPVTVSSFGTSDLLLPGASGRKRRFRIGLREAQAWFASETPLLINGVPRSQKWLKEGDRILLGGYRLDFQAVAVRQHTYPMPAKPALAWQLPSILVLLFLSILFRWSVAPSAGPAAPERMPAEAATIVSTPWPEPKTEPEPAAREEVSAVPAPPAAKAQPPAEPTVAVRQQKPRPPPKTEPQLAANVAKPRPRPSKKPVQPPPSLPSLEVQRVNVRVVAPGEAIEFFPADMLFLHAHPDDESLAFGAMMAAASRSGKRIVTVLFTDGESGKDVFPRRAASGVYPDHALQGEALAEVRVREAQNAMSILGCETYVRLGLKNLPYNGLMDEVPRKAVIDGWGGEEELLQRLEEILLGFRPRIVVSPDFDTGVREHFEHEAVGYLVSRALISLQQKGQTFVQGHLLAVDSGQRQRYSAPIEVDALARDTRSGLTYRQIQTLALKEHVSQRDASLLGWKRLSRFPKEYYRELGWVLEISLQEYLAKPSSQSVESTIELPPGSAPAGG